MMTFNPQKLRRIHIGTDVILVSIAWVGAYYLRLALGDSLGRPINSFDNYRMALPTVVVPWIVSCWAFGIYRSARMSTVIDHIQDLFKGAATSVIIQRNKDAIYGRYERLLDGGIGDAERR